MSNLPPWWRGAGAAIGIVLLFLPGAQLLAIIYWIVYIGALVVTRGSRPASDPDFSIQSEGIFEKVFVGLFPYSLMFIVGLVIMIGVLLS